MVTSKFRHTFDVYGSLELYCFQDHQNQVPPQNLGFVAIGLDRSHRTVESVCGCFDSTTFLSVTHGGAARPPDVVDGRQERINVLFGQGPVGPNLFNPGYIPRAAFQDASSHAAESHLRRRCMRGGLRAGPGDCLQLRPPQPEVPNPNADRGYERSTLDYL